jgi:hypothetical protein
MTRCLALLVVLALVAASAEAPVPADRPTPRTHAHNDYEHPHPLFDALHQGFIGVEADVYLVGNELRVAHDRRDDWSKAPTLDDAYLTPLADLAKRRGNGGVYADGTRLLLLIDQKTEPQATYRRVHEVLAAYAKKQPGLFTTYTKRGGGWEISRGAIEVVISGTERPREAMAAQAVRYAGCDGRMGDVGPDTSPADVPQLVPLISDNWNKVFVGDAKWDGKGEPRAAARAALQRTVEAVHAEGKQFRVWNLPAETPAVWGLLYDAGVDLINTDDLEGLAKFIRSRQ